ncbi:N-acetyltransferase family protein [Sphingomonas koreensis]
MDIRYDVLTGDAARAQPLAPLCARIFPAFELAYLDRLKHVDAPLLCRALADGELIAFKLGYRRGGALFYSWLGGVDPDFRRRGIADALGTLQHDTLAASGYRFVETRTRAANAAMLIVNLRAGFVITGYETDTKGIPVVTQRKMLGAVPAS